MTITYTAQVATSSMGCFLRLLLRWKGSIYKLVWKEFCVFGALYYLLNLVYRFGLNENQKRVFERVSRYCEAFNNLIPLAFVLGFYVSIVISRWWEQFMLIPWPDRMALFVTAHIHGHDERGRLMRRTIMRYLCLSYVITMSSISPVCKKRFPRFQHMTETGFMVPSEQKVLEGIQTGHNKYFVPLAWATSLVTRSRKEGRIKDDFAVKTLIDEINTYRGMLGGLFNYDYISIPLVYTQVVTIAVYTFFLSCLMGRQFVEKGAIVEDMYVPIFTFLQFFFYMGWLKVAESLVNPFGEDDDDFDINALIDRNLQVSYLVVDEMHAEHPELIKDQYWDDVDFEPPYTAASIPSKIEPYLGSAFSVKSLQPHEEEFVTMEKIHEDAIPENVIDVEGQQSVRSLKQTMPKNFGKSMGKSPHRRFSSFTRGNPLFRNYSKRRESDNSNQGSPTDTKEGPDDIFAMSDLLSEHPASSVETGGIDTMGSVSGPAAATLVIPPEDDVVKIIHHRKRSVVNALQNQAHKQTLIPGRHHRPSTIPFAPTTPTTPAGVDIAGGSGTSGRPFDKSYAPSKVLGKGVSTKKSIPGHQGIDDREDSDSENLSSSDMSLVPIVENSTMERAGTASDRNYTGIPTVYPSYKDHTVPSQVNATSTPKPTTSNGAADDEEGENHPMLPRAILDDAEDLKLKKEHQRPDSLTRSVSVAGEDIAKDLKLVPVNLDPRTRTNSEGPSMGMEPRKL